MPDKDDLDVLLDSALATYADPGPDSGLELRVLAAVEAAREFHGRRRFLARTRGWLAWAIAVPVAASLLMWLAMSRTQRLPSTQTQKAYEGAHAPAIGVPSTLTASHAKQASHPPGAEAHQATAHITTRLKITATSEDGLSGTPITSCPFKTTDNADCEPLPKLDVFPTPQALTPQERALAVVATKSPVPLRRALANAQRDDNPPVHIAAIHILPIETQP